MRSSTWLLGSLLVISFAAITPAGCGSSSGGGKDAAPGSSGGKVGSGGNIGSGGGAGGSDAGAACTPMTGNAATIDAGALWGCFETTCMTQLAACASDCVCNNAVLAALQCVAAGGSQMTCFTPLASAGTNGLQVVTCLVSSTSSCAPASDAGSDGGADAAGEGGGADAAGDGSPAGGDAGTEGGASSTFQACLAAVKPNCIVSEQNTAEKLETACASVTLIPVPLTGGTSYGPKTIQGGPYGGKIEWNEGAGTAFVNPVNSSEPICPVVGVQSFMEPASVNAELLNLRGLDSSLYTIFRPACMKEGEKYPVITWANGTCGFTHGYGPLLSTVASHGFVIIASNSTWTATAPTNTVQLRALDYAKALNEDPTSIYYQKLDLSKVGAMGHSQGSMATSNASTDPRIKALILWNGGASNNKPFLYVSGERDVGGTQTPASLAQATTGATQPGAWVYHHQVLQTGGTSTGHLVLMEQPERVVDMAVAWWKYMLNGDEEAKKMFMGDTCGLCNRAAEFEYGHNSLLH